MEIGAERWRSANSTACYEPDLHAKVRGSPSKISFSTLGMHGHLGWLKLEVDPGIRTLCWESSLSSSPHLSLFLSLMKERSQLHQKSAKNWIVPFQHEAQLLNVYLLRF